MGCVKAVVEKKKFVVQFEDGHKIDMNASSLLYLCEKEDTGQEVYGIIYEIPVRGRGELLNIDGDPTC